MQKSYVIAWALLASCDQHDRRSLVTDDGRHYELEWTATRTWHCSHIVDTSGKKIVDYQSTATLTRTDGTDPEPMEVRGNNGLTICPRGTEIAWDPDAGATLTSKPCSFIACTNASDCPEFEAPTFCMSDHRCR